MCVYARALIHPWLVLTGLPPSVAIAVACRDIDVRNVKALIMGPHETPYEFGFFEVCDAVLVVQYALTKRLWQFAIRFNKGRDPPLHRFPSPGSDSGQCLEYPSKSPNVQCVTTNGGRCRFNPNIYSNGKVCL